MHGKEKGVRQEWRNIRLCQPLAESGTLKHCYYSLLSCYQDTLCHFQRKYSVPKSQLCFHHNWGKKSQPSSNKHHATLHRARPVTAAPRWLPRVPLPSFCYVSYPLLPKRAFQFPQGTLSYLTGQLSPTSLYCVLDLEPDCSLNHPQ